MPRRPSDRSGAVRYLRARPFFSRPLVPPSFQERLQNQYRRHLVNDPLASHRRVTCIIEMPVRLGRRQSLVPKMHSDPKLCPQLFSKRLRFGCLRALVARHIQRVPHHRLRHPMLAKHSPHGLQIRSTSRTMQRKQWLCGIPKRVRECQSNPPVPNIETQNPRDKRALLLRSLRLLVRPLGLEGFFRHDLECNGHTLEAAP